MLLNDAHNFRRLGQSPRSRCTTGELSHSGRDNRRAACCQASDILLRDWILPHPRIHRGRDEERRTGCEDTGRQHIVRHTRRRLCDKIRRCGRDKHKLCELRKCDVFDVMMRLAPHRLCDGLPRDLAERERRDKGGRCPRHNDAHICACLFEAACNLHRLVCGDAARHTEDNAPPRKSTHVKRSLCRGHS